MQGEEEDAVLFGGGFSGELHCSYAKCLHRDGRQRIFVGKYSQPHTSLSRLFTFLCGGGANASRGLITLNPRLRMRRGGGLRGIRPRSDVV